MNDVFLSYASSDRDTAEKLAKLLQELGLSVFWDREISPGHLFDEVIEDRLQAAAAIVVLWSESAIGSRWVRAEAEEGAARNVLIPALIDDVKPPLAFRQIQAINLTQSKISLGDSEISRLLKAVGDLVGGDLGKTTVESGRLMALIESLIEADGGKRTAAARALQRMGPKAAEAMPQLIKSLESDDFDFVDAVVDAVDGIDLNQAMPALKRLESRLLRERGGGVIDGSMPQDNLLGKLFIMFAVF